MTLRFFILSVFFQFTLLRGSDFASETQFHLYRYLVMSWKHEFAIHQIFQNPEFQHHLKACASQELIDFLLVLSRYPSCLSGDYLSVERYPDVIQALAPFREKPFYVLLQQKTFSFSEQLETVLMWLILGVKEDMWSDIVENMHYQNVSFQDLQSIFIYAQVQTHYTPLVYFLEILKIWGDPFFLYGSQIRQWRFIIHVIDLILSLKNNYRMWERNEEVCSYLRQHHLDPERLKIFLSRLPDVSGAPGAYDDVLNQTSLLIKKYQHHTRCNIQSLLNWFASRENKDVQDSNNFRSFEEE